MFKTLQLSLTDFQNRQLSDFQEEYKTALCPKCRFPLKVNAFWREGQIVVASGYCQVHGSCSPEEILREA